MTPVGVTQRVVVDPKHGERRDALDQRWARLLAQASIMPIPLPNYPELALEIVRSMQVAGILLSGGDDLIQYGGDAPERDTTEQNLILWARKNATPLLGICRGMQALQHSFGVRLRRGSGHVTPRHEIIADGALRIVNSYHNLVTTESVPDLEVWAWAKDGVVEAVRHSDERLAGIMWHPERCSEPNSTDVQFIASFFGALK